VTAATAPADQRKPFRPRSIPLASIDGMEETAVRAGPLNAEHAATMVPFIADLPPVDVVALAGGRYGLLCGYHRVETHRLAGRANVKALVHDLPPEEWLAFAVRSNVTHGLPLTLAERKAAARRMLDASDRRSDRAIAADCGLSPPTIAKLRHPEAEDDSTEKDFQLAPAVRVGRDGKARHLPRAVALSPEAGSAVPEPPPITKPDLGDGISHPARFSDDLLRIFADLLPVEEYPVVLDPFAGTGRIHELPNRTVGIEIEGEWAAMHPDTICGDALDLLGLLGFQPGRPNENVERMDAICTSPTFGNRLADHHDACDPELRRSYTHDLGRQLSTNNSGTISWGDEYRNFHRWAWFQAVDVLRPGGRFVLNIKDHVRRGEIQPVAFWHLATLVDLGLSYVEARAVDTRHLRAGANGDLRCPEWVIVLDKP
jgi:hypothetical protein